MFSMPFRLERVGLLITAFFLTAPHSHAATIYSFAGGFASSTAGFWGIEFRAGGAGDRISSIRMQIPDPGFFDFDGSGNYGNQTAPIFDATSSLGLTASDVLFSFVGVNPQILNIQFASGAFAAGD